MLLLNFEAFRKCDGEAVSPLDGIAPKRISKTTPELTSRGAVNCFYFHSAVLHEKNAIGRQVVNPDDQLKRLKTCSSALLRLGR